MARLTIPTPDDARAGLPSSQTPGSGWSLATLIAKLNTMLTELYGLAPIAAGVATSSALTTAAGADATITVTDALIAATKPVMAALRTDGTNTGGTPQLVSVTPGAGSVAIVVHNAHATDAFNGTLKLSYAVLPVV